MSTAPTSTTPDLDDAKTPEDAARFLAVSPKTLANWRSLGEGPRFVRYGGRRVAYLVSDLVEYREGPRAAA